MGSNGRKRSLDMPQVSNIRIKLAINFEIGYNEIGSYFCLRFKDNIIYFDDPFENIKFDDLISLDNIIQIIGFNSNQISILICNEKYIFDYDNTSLIKQNIKEYITWRNETPSQNYHKNFECSVSLNTFKNI